MRHACIYRGFDLQALKTKAAVSSSHETSHVRVFSLQGC